jgi:hypothetical protein
LVETVRPATWAVPLAPSATELAVSVPVVPPSTVEYTSDDPVEFSFDTNPSKLAPVAVWSNAPAVVGKFVDKVSPATYAWPLVSTAIPWPLSLLPPPRKVE